MLSRVMRTALLVLGACSGTAATTSTSGTATPARPAETQPGPPFVAPGERMTYRVTLQNVHVASFVMAVGDPAPLGAGKAIVVQTQAQSEGVAALVKAVKAEFATYLDVATGAPQLFRVVETAGNDDPTVEENEARLSELSEGKFPIVIRRPDGTERIEQQVATQPPIDIISLLVALRSWDGQKGDRRTYEVVRSRYMWRTEARLVERKALVTELGQLPTVRFDAKTQRLMRDGSLDPGMETRTFSVWISDDADRVPLLFTAKSDYGNIKLELVDYAGGTAPNLAHR